jgi:hypothetical protein
VFDAIRKCILVFSLGRQGGATMGVPGGKKKKKKKTLQRWKATLGAKKSEFYSAPSGG